MMRLLAISLIAVMTLSASSSHQVVVRMGEPVAVLSPPQEPKESSADWKKIDAVFAARGPGLGLTLRRQLVEAVLEESQVAGFDPLLILGVIAVESEFNDSAVSCVGARGLMQIRPSTLDYIAKKEGLRLSFAELERDPALRVRLGIRYLKMLRDRFNDLDLALMAYNGGPNKLAANLKEGNREEFRNYARAVRRQHELITDSVRKSMLALRDRPTAQ